MRQVYHFGLLVMAALLQMPSAIAEEAAANEVGVPVCDDFVNKRRACHAGLADRDGAERLNKSLEVEIVQFKTLGPIAAKLCQAELDNYRERKLLGCQW